MQVFCCRLELKNQVAGDRFEPATSVNSKCPAMAAGSWFRKAKRTAEDAPIGGVARLRRPNLEKLRTKETNQCSISTGSFQGSRKLAQS